MINIQKVHVYSAAGAFLAKKRSKNHEKYEHIKNIMKICNFFSAAGAFLAKKILKNHENMKISKKS